MKISFWTEQYMLTLIECPEDINDITKNHTKAVSGRFSVISLFLQKLILEVT